MATTEMEDWDRVAEFVEQRRGYCGFKSQEAAAKAAGIGVTSWREVESGRPVTLVIQGAIAKALGLPTNALTTVARGDVVESSTSAEVEDRLSRLEAIVAGLVRSVEGLLERAEPTA